MQEEVDAFEAYCDRQGYVRFSDHIEEAFIRRIESAGKSLAREHSKGVHLLVHGHPLLMNLLLTTCSQGVKAPEVPGVEFHIANDELSAPRDMVHVEIKDDQSLVLGSRSVLHRSGLSDTQHEVYTQLYTDGMPPDTASEAAENLA